MSLGGVAEITVDNGSLALALGLGLNQATEKIYFNQLKSTALALRQNGFWQKVGGLDASLELGFSSPGSPAFQQVLSTLGNPTLIVSASSDDLFGAEPPRFSVDFDLE